MTSTEKYMEMFNATDADTALKASIQESKSLCPLPWLHLSFNTDSSVRVCCNTDHGGSILTPDGKPILKDQIESFEQIANNPFMKNLRKEMMADSKPDFCRTCHKVEEGGAPSVRNIYLSQYPSEMMESLKATEADGTVDMKVKYLDFSLGNECNIKCRMCNPSASYHMRTEFEELSKSFDLNHAVKAQENWEIDEKFKRFLTEMFTTTELILTTGGEPFISKKHRAILETAIASGKSKNIRLMYHTNLTTVPDELVGLWKSFKQIDVHGSIEAFGDLNEYVRWPSKWNKVESNIEKLLGLQKEIPLWMEIHTVFQPLSVLKLPVLWEYLLTYNDRIPPLSYLIWLDHPTYLAPTVLPPELRELAFKRAMDFFEKHRERLTTGPWADFNKQKIEIAKSHFERLLNAPYDEAEFSRFGQLTLQQDVYRKQDVFVQIPELRPYREFFAPPGLTGNV